MFKQTFVYLRLFTLLLILSHCKGKPELVQRKDNAGPVEVDAMVASLRPVSNAIEVNGNVVASEYVELHTEASGRLTYLNVPEGKKIAAGTVIARVNSADLEATLAKTKVQLDLAQKTEERYKQLLAVNGLNQSDYDIALNTVNGFKADMAVTRALIDKTVLKAPFSGVIGLRRVSLGAYVDLTTTIATLQQLDKIRIDFTIPEEYGSMLKVGNTVDVIRDASGQKKDKAQIIAVEPQVDQSSRSLTVRALLQNSNPNPGAFVKVSLNSGAQTQAVMIPTNCLIPDDKNNQVILVKNGKASFVNVITSLRLSNNVIVTKGVSPGDTVVVTGVLFARPKAQLKVRSIKTLEQFAAQNNNAVN